MAASTQAASFIGAVLEQAGYLIQADFLKQLRDFFREAGAFIYILGAIGALISYVMFGSFRAARYLLIGPALYWFLVGPTFTFDGVVWRVGNGAYRGLNGRRGYAAAQENVKDVLQKADISQPGNGIEVAYGFALFVRLINAVTEEMTELIVNARNDDEYLRYVSKGLALDSALRIQITNPELINMLEEDFFARCSNAYAYSVAASAAELRPEMISMVTSAGANAVQARKAEYEAKAKDGLDKFTVSPNGNTLNFLKLPQGSTITCHQMWVAIGKVLETDAALPTQKIIELAVGDNSNKDKACERVLQKIANKNDAAGGCQQKLQRAVAMMMLKNTVFDRRASSRFVKRIVSTLGESSMPKDLQDYLNSPGTIVGKNGVMSDRAMAYSIAMAKQAETLQAGGVGRMNAPDSLAALLGYTEMQIATVGAAENWNQSRIDKERNQAKSIAKASAMVGTMDAGLTEYPKRHLRDLRQQLFTWAINLPYWQGVLLYVLAAAYPFMALIVLLPGRAAGFLNLPMAWLWVKSWDVGLAFVMLFEKVLWNILPSLKVKNAVLSSPIAGQAPWELFGEAQKFDHTWNLHIYYISLSMVTLSIPAITGYATLRARRAVLSSFTEKLMADARDAGGLAAGSYGTSIMAERTKAQTDLQAHVMSLAGRQPHHPGYGNMPAPRLDGSGKPVVALDKHNDSIPQRDLKGNPVPLLGPGGKPVSDGKGGHMSKPQYQMAPGEREAESRQYALAAAAGALGKDGLATIAKAGISAFDPTTLEKNLIANGVALDLVKSAVIAYQETYKESMMKWHEFQQAELGAFHPVYGRWGILGMQNIAYVAAVDGYGGYEITPHDVNSVEKLIGLQKFQFEQRINISNKILQGLPPIGDKEGKIFPAVSMAEMSEFVFNPSYHPNADTPIGVGLKAIGFGERRERAQLPEWATRGEGESALTNQGMYNYEIASWKERYEASPRMPKHDGTPISEDEYKRSVQFHRDLNLKMKLGPEGAYHMEVAPGEFRLDVPEKIIDLLEKNIKLDGNYNMGPGGFLDRTPVLPIVDPIKTSIGLPSPDAAMYARIDTMRKNEEVVLKMREKRESEQVDRRWYATRRDFDDGGNASLGSIADLLRKDKEENKSRLLAGRIPYGGKGSVRG